MCRLKFTALFCVIVLGGCEVYESFGGVPTASDELAVPPQTTTQQIFDCAEKSIGSVPEPSNWRKDVTRRDPNAGILETGDFDKENTIGFRARLRVDPGGALARIKIKGAGPYYTDLGVDDAMITLKTNLARCLARSPNSRAPKT